MSRQTNNNHQPRKDSGTKRVNFDNERASKFDSEYSRKSKPGKSNSNKGKKNKPNNNNRNTHKKQSDPGDVTTKKVGSNEIAWYSKNPELVKASGSYPFAPILGQPLNPKLNMKAVPGVMRITYAPNYYGGEAISARDANRQCFDSMFSYLVHANSRNYNYEPADLGVLTLAGFNVFSAIAHVTRAYGIARNFQESSLYSPDTLLQAMGFDYKNFRENLGRVWFDINFIIDRTKQIWIPNTMPLLQRQFWMNSNVFLDAEVGAAQMYVLVPEVFYEYQPIVGSSGGGLIAATYDPAKQVSSSTSSYRQKFLVTSSNVNGWKWDVWYDVIMHMIDQLVKDEDRGIIYGDILQAFGKDKIFALPSISADYSVVPVYNEEALTQIENLTIMSDFSINAYMQDLTDRRSMLVPIYDYNSNGVATDTQAATANLFAPNRVLLNFHQQQQPTPDQVMVATRLTTCGTLLKSVKTTTNAFTVNKDTGALVQPTVTSAVQPVPYACGTEIVTNLRIYVQPVNSNSTSSDTLSYARTIDNTSGATVYPNSWYQGLTMLMAFDWHPFMYGLIDSKLTKDIVGEWCYNIIPAGDYENYTIISPHDIEKLHYVALWSLYDIPII